MLSKNVCLFSASLIVIAAAQAQAGDIVGPQTNSQIDARTDATFGKMTPAEKISLIHGPMPSIMSASKRPVGVSIGAGFIEGVPRLGIPRLVETDASLGVSNLLEMRKGDVATALPSGISLASSWDPQVARAGGAMIGGEARAKGFNVMLVGGVNLVRDPRAGRNFEYLGEDPLLAGTLVGAQIVGVQSNHIIATIKHFALNNQETGRNIASIVMSEADMRESDLLAFEIGIEKGNPGAVMCGYNRVGGSFACENAFLLNDVLRRDWGYRGFVMSDWGAVHSSEAILKGLDQQSGEQIDGKPYFSELMEKAIGAGRIPSSAVDVAAQRVLRSIYAHGVADHPLQAGLAIDYAANGAISQQAAEDGIVLLRNVGNILPIAADVRTIAVIGGHADLGVAGGGGSSQVVPVGGFRKLTAVGTGAAAAFAKRGYGGTPPLDGLRSALPNAAITYLDGADVAAAAALAKSSDLAIVFTEKYATEAQDQSDLSLGEGQDELVRAIAKANPRTVIVLQTGNAVIMPWRDDVPAIVSAWYSGQQGGAAIARVLTGAVNPAGHLPVTFPASLDQLPNPKLPGSNAAPADKETRAVYGLQAGTKPFDIRYPEGADVGYRWFARKGLKPAYPFGFGLSYTQFQYSDLIVSGGDRLTVRFKVKNIGQRAGADVPQVYVGRSDLSKRLIGWGKPMLAPGETRDVTVVADPRLLGHYDIKRQRWMVAAGLYRVEIGTSASDTVLTASTRMRRASIRP